MASYPSPMAATDGQLAAIGTVPARLELGLRWSDIDLRARTLTVNQTRVLVEYRVRIEEPKSRNGKGTLPLDGELVTALRKRQLEESTLAGATYGSGVAGLSWYQGREYVITDAAGTPVHPQWYTDEPGPPAQAGRGCAGSLCTTPVTRP